jgi:hypothetical protein
MDSGLSLREPRNDRSIWISSSPRHCERSEAIHLAARRKNGLFRFARNDGCVRQTTRRANHFRFTEILSSLKIKNISLLQKGKPGYIFAHPVPPEGRIMIARIVGTGRGGRW